MSEQNHPINILSQNELLLQAEVKALAGQLVELEQSVSTFESALRSQLADELIEVQELTILYKEQKQTKKEKRLAQKQRGKNYQPPVALKVVPERISKKSSDANEKERKRLYREAMLHVHPDKFNMNEEQSDLATEVTTKLIEIYKSGDLGLLEDYHAHIFSGNAMLKFVDKPKELQKKSSNSEYLKREKERLLNEIELIKARYTYKVLTSYPNPMTFVKELKAYYIDRINKLKRRTRTK